MSIANVDWSRVKVLFAEALDQPAEQRDAWLQAASADDAVLLQEVRSLLQARTQSGTSFLGDASPRDWLPESADAARTEVNAKIGPYRLLRLLGEGGMGLVYLAERADGQFQQNVALKLIRPEFVTPALLGRFQRERDLLARLIHPNIAQLYDGGVTQDGLPYFTLEYVKGDRITNWCDAHKLDIRARVTLFLSVCDAVQYAHRNLVVHRDLKPSNILVSSDGQSKLVDFGIAKPLAEDALHVLTQTQAQPMTREYAAPEQVLGEAITTATDVYSLGVVLYELLSGHLPYVHAESGASSWQKAIVEQTPESLHRAIERRAPGATDADLPNTDQIALARGMTAGAMRRALRGDLDRIVQRALAKPAEARYPSVSAFADDLRAWSEQRPISGGTRSYRIKKYISLYWLPLTIAAALLCAILVGAAGIAWEARLRTEQAELALRQTQATTAMKDFLLGLFTAIDPREAKGKEISAHDVVDRGAQRIDNNATLDPEQKAEFESTLGRIYFQLGHFDQANKLQQSAMLVLGNSTTQTQLAAQTSIDQAFTYRALGDLKTAAKFAGEADARLQALPQAAAADRARALNAHGGIALDARDFPAALRYAKEEFALAASEKLDTRILFEASMLAGGASWGLIKLDDAETFYRRAMALAAEGQPPDELGVARARLNTAIVLQRKSRFEEAQQLELESLATFEKILGPNHADALQDRRDLGLSYFHLGRYAKARAELEKVLTAQKAQLGESHPALAGTLINLGLAEADSGALDQAEQTFTRAREIFEQRFGHEHDGTLSCIGNLGYVHLLKHQLEQAQSELNEVRAIEIKNGSGEDVSNDYRLGEVERQRGDVKAATDIEQVALSSAQKNYGESSRYTALAHHYLALSLRDGGDLARAEQQLRAALASFAGYIPGARHPLAATTRIALANILAQRTATRVEAIALATDALALRNEFLQKDDPRLREAKDLLDRIKAMH